MVCERDRARQMASTGNGDDNDVDDSSGVDSYNNY